jgi:hypothetical protein
MAQDQQSKANPFSTTINPDRALWLKFAGHLKGKGEKLGVTLNGMISAYLAGEQPCPHCGGLASDPPKSTPGTKSSKSQSPQPGTTTTAGAQVESLEEIHQYQEAAFSQVAESMLAPEIAALVRLLRSGDEQPLRIVRNTLKAWEKAQRDNAKLREEAPAAGAQHKGRKAG